MNKIFIVTASLFLMTSNGDSAVLNSYPDEFSRLEITEFAQEDDLVPTISELVLMDIESEIAGLAEDEYDAPTRRSFAESAEQLKGLLLGLSIHKTPDVLIFKKGYVGLSWDAKNDDSLFLYSIPGGTIFYNRVGKEGSKTATVYARKKPFNDLIKKINSLV